MMQRNYHTILRRYCTRSALPADFLLFPRFFDPTEQYALLSAALRKLDAAEPRAARKRRRDFLASHQQDRPRDTGDLNDVFLPDKIYHFEEGHYDGVIKRYREMRVSTWDDENVIAFKAALGRLETLYPSAGNTQTHLLHLASDGEIRPHIDSIDASGSWILGVSLGSDRVLRMESVEADSDCSPRHTFEVTLPSGSVYVQRDVVRYKYKHSILSAESKPTHGASRGQRLSIMVRDCLPPIASEEA